MRHSAKRSCFFDIFGSFHVSSEPSRTSKAPEIAPDRPKSPFAALGQLSGNLFVLGVACNQR
jgi:hypothetical protein